MKIYLGIDWGTHSSKWAAIIPSNDTTALWKGIIRSDLLLYDNEVIMDPSDDYHSEIERVRSLKRHIIEDPYTPFWAHRDDIGMSMGAGVAFSICSLFGDFISTFQTERSQDAIEIGFSFPNWLRENDTQLKKAASNYHQAIIISASILNHYFPRSGKPHSVKKWQALIEDVRSRLSLPSEFGLSIADFTKMYCPTDFGVDVSDKLTWRYLVESCAAGLPYLRNITLDSPPGLPHLGKLLVVDVGAGSTDVGYMLRTVGLDNTEHLFYLPPAATFSVAGNKLTEDIKDFHYSTGKSITFAEAENYKITTSEWIKKPFALRWMDEICEHVEEYVFNSPDKRWLDADVPLQLIITGGSGIVEGLATRLKETVTKALVRRGVMHNIAEKVNLINENRGGPRNSDSYIRCKIAV